MKKRYCLPFVAFLCFLVFGNLDAQVDLPTPKLPTIPNKVFNIKDFGGVSDNKTDNTTAIQKAIDAANNAGGGKVVVPEGVYLCGPLVINSNLELHLDEGVTLKLLPLSRYPGGTTDGTDFIHGEKLHDIAITGKGTIDGQGADWWPFAKTDKTAKRPRMISLKECDKILIEDVTLMNSPMFHIAIGGKSSNGTVSRVTVRAPASDDAILASHNTDACDVSGKDFLIKDCDISTGDDDFTSGSNTSNVHVMNCKFGYGHGLSMGSYTRGGASNFLVENCTFNNTECGIRIKSDRDRGGLVQNLVYRNLKMTNVGIPILIYSSYMTKDKEFRNLQKVTGSIASAYPSAPVTDLTPIFSNITFQDITATAASGKRAGLIWGLPEALATNIIFKNVNISASTAFGIFFAKNVRFENCKISTIEGLNKLDMTNAEVSIDGKAVK
ncbi:glycoside hydrolase family 28 protein [Parasediminibacterium sp. JCM 36343]|uniref:glycoside hydrolase family 28 protein n=1 Tax=Parasediminibacterium sp. JCM 36343 TaxID=3374279 RepID=UPI00397C0E2D